MVVQLHIIFTTNVCTQTLYVYKQWKRTSFPRQKMQPSPKWECVWLRCDGQMTVSPLIAASHTQQLDTAHKHRSFFASTNGSIDCFYSICFQTAFKWIHYMSNNVLQATSFYLTQSFMTDRETPLAEIVGQMSLSKYRRFDPILGLHQCKRTSYKTGKQYT